MPTIPLMNLANDERVKQIFQWREYPYGRNSPLHYVSWQLTTWRIVALVHEENRDEYSWETFYDFHKLGEGMQVTVDDDSRLYLDLFPPRTLRFDGSTIQEV